jgi:hypothetical protein
MNPRRQPPAASGVDPPRAEAVRSTPTTAPTSHSPNATDAIPPLQKPVRHSTTTAYDVQTAHRGKARLLSNPRCHGNQYGATGHPGEPDHNPRRAEHTSRVRGRRELGSPSRDRARHIEGNPRSSARRAAPLPAPPHARADRLRTVDPARSAVQQRTRAAARLPHQATEARPQQRPAARRPRSSRESWHPTCSGHRRPPTHTMPPQQPAVRRKQRPPTPPAEELLTRPCRLPSTRLGRRSPRAWPAARSSTTPSVRAVGRTSKRAGLSCAGWAGR